MFQLSIEEAAEVRSLRSQFVTLKIGRGRHRKFLPFAFTEHGAMMAANVLKSTRTAQRDGIPHQGRGRSLPGEKKTGPIMNPEQARKTIVETFRQKFDDARFLYLIRNLVNHLDESKKQTWTLKKAAFEDYVNHFTRLGTYTDPRGERADVLIIHLRKETTLARGRVTLRNFVADYLSTGHGQGKAAVMAAFVSPQEDDWRFSFVKLDYTFEKSELGLLPSAFSSH